ncbi:MAG: hypothetical protein GQ527_02535 [Bacteroidales bacterium]|nr:hypothetical protein [Bacteroidales bacterium]
MKKIFLVFSCLFLGLIISEVKAQDSDVVDKLEFGRNNISLTMSDVIFKRISFQYERIIGDNGTISITVPFSYAFDEVNVSYNTSYSMGYGNLSMENIVDYSDWYIGLGFNLYPAGQGAFRAYFGPEIRMGPAHISREQIDYVYEGDKDVIYPEDIEYTYSSFLLNIGAIYEPAENFIVSLNLGVGAQSGDDEMLLQFAPAFRIGFRF